MPVVESDPRRRFALDVVRTLRSHGHTAYWAGGCVRDQLLGQQPKDYDVATDASPPRVQEVFRRRRTLAIGAAFGVICVVGPKGAGQVDVVTFREEADYLDGRRPQAVTFSSPEADARRRDFTINGLFFDPLAGEVLDFVGGQEDLARGIVRAIGDPYERFREDKLRMLRAVRFSAALSFELEERTRRAVVERASEVAGVSPERIAGELRRMFTHPRRAQAVALLRDTGQLAAVLPEALERAGAPPWSERLAVLAGLPEPELALALAGLFWGVADSAAAEAAGRRLRLATHEIDRVAWLLDHAQALFAAQGLPWPRLQRLLLEAGIGDLLALHEAVAGARGLDRSGLEFCRAVLARPAAQWNPAPLLTGEDLKRIGVPPGPIYRELLEQLRDAQLLGQVATPEEAESLAKELWRSRADDKPEQ
jgi:tRNA nucleotidyltransferase/poly(A) polymerase